MSNIQTQAYINVISAQTILNTPIGENLISTFTRTLVPYKGAIAYDIGTEALYVGNGTIWLPSGASAVYTAIFPVNATDNNGIIIDNVGDTIRLEIANNVFPGIISTSPQNFSGVKRFENGIQTPSIDTIVPGTLTFGGNATLFDFTLTNIANFRGGIGDVISIGVNVGLAGSGGVFIGQQAGQNNTVGGSIFIGDMAGSLNTINQAIGIGPGALRNNTGSSNNAIGVQALSANTTGFGNNAFGFLALASSTGDGNTAFGNQALFVNTIGNGNTAFGHDTMVSNTTGNNNTALGPQSLFNNVSGNQNIAIGFVSMIANMTSSFNVGIGSFSLFSNMTGNENVAVGDNACISSTAISGQTAVGASSLRSNMTGIQNSAFGFSSLVLSSAGSNLTAIGYQAASHNIIGNNNTALGCNSLFSSVIGNNNTALGNETLNSITSGNDNIAIGNLAGSALTAADSGNVIIQNIGVSGDVDTIRIGNPVAGSGKNFQSGIRGIAVVGGLTVEIDANGQLGTVPSSRFLKTDINTLTDVKDIISKLNPVTYKLIDDSSGKVMYGMIADEVKKLLPDIVITYKEEYETVQYQYLPIILLKEIQRLQIEVDNLKANKY